MPDWRVFYRDQLDQDRTSGRIATKEGALKRAKDLHRQRAELYRIEGPDGATVPRMEIMHWVADNKY